MLLSAGVSFLCGKRFSHLTFPGGRTRGCWEKPSLIPKRTSPAPRRSRQESEAVTRPGGDDAAGRAGHSWPLPARSPTPLAWVTAPAKLPDTETPRGLRVSGTILRLMGSDNSTPPSSAPSLPPLLPATRPAPRCPLSRPGAPQQLAQACKSPPSLLSGLGWERTAGSSWRGSVGE
jgi:hypothetical protein